MILVIIGCVVTGYVMAQPVIRVARHIQAR